MQSELGPVMDNERNSFLINENSTTSNVLCELFVSSASSEMINVVFSYIINVLLTIILVGEDSSESVQGHDLTALW